MASWVSSQDPVRSTVPCCPTRVPAPLTGVSRMDDGDESRGAGSAGPMTETGRSFWRLVISTSAAAVLTAACWTLVPDRLSVSTDVVSSLIFNDSDVLRYDYAYYFTAFMFPLVAISLYFFLDRKGPLRYRGGERPAVLPLCTATAFGGDVTRPLLGGGSAVRTSTSASGMSGPAPLFRGHQLRSMA